MGESHPSIVFRFAGFILNPSRAVLRSGDGSEISLRPKTFDVLRHLLANAGRLVTREELLAAVWPGLFVADESVTGCVAEIRRALRDDGRLLRTLPKRGYLLEAEVIQEEAGSPPSEATEKPTSLGGRTLGEASYHPPLPADHPSLVVLPFANLSGDPDQEYFSDGMTEELINQLSRARWFYVIARNSSFTYKGRAVDPRQVGRDLGIQYVLEGSVRRAAGRVRISCQLIDAQTGHQLWAERFEGTLDDIFDLQDRVAEAVAGAIEPSLQHAEIQRARAKPTGSLNAYDLLLQAMHCHRTMTREGDDQALCLLRAAIELDPEFALGKAQLAYTTIFLAAHNRGNEAILEEGVRCAREALASSRDDPLVLAFAALALAFHVADYPTARAAAARAQAMSPNSVQIAVCAGWVYALNSEPELALQAFQRAQRLSPLDPAVEYVYVGLSSVHVALGDYASALEWAERAVQIAPNYAPGHRYLIIASWLLGREDAARAAATRMLALFPNARAQMRRYRDDSFRQKIVGALIAAGIPE
ncbi:winged helix-turn-helix domain-containing tetratricopeptide repeat protein [Sabulicella rubraurantiaca]|uniref:winged helix-turn-helix domain-containing tetratricopeptide repeat protein n=1 Tax=Sabulicella rubraurantiaca TaxID=2811429 RepID=UPI001A9722C1|nr:winged helix-turn-helix domain-containing tetratricopeptide repeat protein [Sabulicella rubraurantiaca]